MKTWQFVVIVLFLTANIIGMFVVVETVQKARNEIRDLHYMQIDHNERDLF